MSRYKNIEQRGDTIIEVLIAIVILAVILVGAYTTSNNSLIGERDAQEHAEAVTIAQDQVEDLRSYVLANDCFSTDNNPDCVVARAGGDYKCLGYDGSTLEGITQNCAIPPTDSSGDAQQQPSSCNVSWCYDIDITATNSTTVSLNVSATTYEVDVTWNSLKGGNNAVQLYYTYSLYKQTS
jgi:prepilin-type N-terminal cleavage/methylation domain-containing protein